MNIGELAKRTGLTPSRIRFYESAGLLQTVAHRPNGYRTFSPEAMLALELITTAQQVGFSLDEIRVLLPATGDDWNHDALLAALRRKVGEIESLEARLARSKAQLMGLMRDVESRPGDADNLSDARRVLSRVLSKLD
ncbi:MerR family transcriptional regulator [Achromobacter xylosoxidans]|uniref:MerR family transcriptional regulator n=1 Tax=Alcaligenes xylosoxydans xylosoxydans TaxID=85698 RepID=UPI003760642E